MAGSCKISAMCEDTEKRHLYEAPRGKPAWELFVNWRGLIKLYARASKFLSSFGFELKYNENIASKPKLA